MGKQYYVYILASRKNGLIYTGVTSDLIGRVYIHRNELVAAHTSRYHIHKLVYFEVFSSPRVGNYTRKAREELDQGLAGGADREGQSGMA